MQWICSKTFSDVLMHVFPSTDHDRDLSCLFFIMCQMFADTLVTLCTLCVCTGSIEKHLRTFQLHQYKKQISRSMDREHLVFQLVKEHCKITSSDWNTLPCSVCAETQLWISATSLLFLVVFQPNKVPFLSK